MWTAVTGDEKCQELIDRSFSIKCPHCNTQSNLSAISIPRLAQARRYQIEEVIVGFRCDACCKSVGLRFDAKVEYDSAARNRPAVHRLELSEEFTELERCMETFDYQYLPPEVGSDFREALVSFSNGCPNAAAAMCRRTIQSAATNLGASGTTKVMSQVDSIREEAGIDDVTFAALKQIILDGHDGAHPHLPALTSQRARVLVEMMKDVLYQIYVRKAKVQHAMQLREDAVAEKHDKKIDPTQ